MSHTAIRVRSTSTFLSLPVVLGLLVAKVPSTSIAADVQQGRDAGAPPALGPHQVLGEKEIIGDESTHTDLKSQVAIANGSKSLELVVLGGDVGENDSTREDHKSQPASAPLAPARP